MSNISAGIRLTANDIYCYSVSGDAAAPEYKTHKKFSVQAEKWDDFVTEALGYITTFVSGVRANSGGLVLMHHGTPGRARSVDSGVLKICRLEGACYSVMGKEFSGRLLLGVRRDIAKVLGSTVADEFMSKTCKEFRGLENWGKIGIEFKEAGAAAVAALAKFGSK